jgi:hypothetical protein
MQFSGLMRRRNKPETVKKLTRTRKHTTADMTQIHKSHTTKTIK